MWGLRPPPPPPSPAAQPVPQGPLQLAKHASLRHSPGFSFASCHPLRSWLLPLGRVLLYCLPSFRQVGTGTALMLEEDPRPGLRGAAADFARVLGGTRMLGLATTPLVLAEPPGATLLTQIALVAIASHSSAYCGTKVRHGAPAPRRPGGGCAPAVAGRLRLARLECTALVGRSRVALPAPPAPSLQLLSAPLTRQRIRALAAGVDLAMRPAALAMPATLALPGLAGYGERSTGLPRRSTCEKHCAGHRVRAVHAE